MKREALNLWAFAGLLVLLAVTVSVAYLPLGHFNLFVSLAIASLKAIIIAFIFMEAWEANAVVKVLLVTTVLWTMMFGVLSFADYLTRGWPVNPVVWSHQWIGEGRAQVSPKVGNAPVGREGVRRDPSLAEEPAP